MGRENLSMWREMFMKEIGRMRKRMAMASQLHKVMHIMQDNGFMINRMVKAKNYDQMEQVLREIMLMESNSVKGYTQLQMVLNMQENLQIIAFEDMEHTILRWNQICRIMEVKQLCGQGVKIFKFAPRNFYWNDESKCVGEFFNDLRNGYGTSITAMEEQFFRISLYIYIYLRQ